MAEVAIVWKGDQDIALDAAKTVHPRCYIRDNRRDPKVAICTPEETDNDFMWDIRVCRAIDETGVERW